LGPIPNPQSPIPNTQSPSGIDKNNNLNINFILNAKIKIKN
jgi:hypothetical protein